MAVVTPLNREACEKLIDLIWKWDHLAMFHEPVDPTVVEGYTAAIPRPIDLSTIRSKLARSSGVVTSLAAPTGPATPTISSEGGSSSYTCDTDLINDLDLMITNALTFNVAGTIWHSHAKTLRKRLSSEFIPMVAGLQIDEEELEYLDKGTKKESVDYSKSMLKEERKKTENISVVLNGMEEDLSIPIEELRKRFALKAGAKREREAEESSSASSSASDDSSDSSSEGSESGSSSGSGSADS
eukprot:GILI01025326.1.p1 GENE.GILI01025326.1~~GILI01025326.1.p1  ORF type:complete len:242 (-),score=46.04 GILI01025326.1:85-810(-)